MWEGPRSPRVAPSSSVGSLELGTQVEESGSGQQIQEEELGEAFDLLFVRVDGDNKEEGVEDETATTTTEVEEAKENSLSPSSESDRNRAESAANNMDDSDGDADEKTLHQAAKEGNLKSVIALLSDGRGSRAVNALDSDSLAPLHYAARYGHLEVVRQLVNNDADPGLKGLEDITPLHLCAK